MTHDWFTRFLGCPNDTIPAAVEMYFRTRRSLNLFIRQREAANVAPAGILAGSQMISQRGAAGDGAIQSEPPSPMPLVGTTQMGNGTSLHTPYQQAFNTGVPVRGLQNGNQSPAAALPSMAEPGVIYPLPDAAEDTRKANYGFQHFRDSCFRGHLTQSIEFRLRDYNIYSRQHRLSASQKADYFEFLAWPSSMLSIVNILDDPARTLLFNNARDNMSFEHMAEMMVAEFNSNARQIQLYGIFPPLG